MRTLDYANVLSLDLTEGSGQSRALVVYVHGGSFLYGTPRDRLAQHFAPLFSDRNIAFASINYQKGGRPSRAFPNDAREKIFKAADQSATFFPEVRAQLFSLLLYRAVSDIACAVRFLQTAEDGPQLSQLPLSLIGLSAGGLAVSGYTYGLDALELDRASPVVTFALSSIPPQPWRIKGNDPHSIFMTAADDAVFPSIAVQRAEALLEGRKAPVVFDTLPMGGHNQPIKEVLTDCSKKGWSDFIVSTVESNAMPA